MNGKFDPLRRVQMAALKLPDYVLGNPLLPPQILSAPRHTYHSSWKEKSKQKSVISYIKTRFFRYLVSACKKHTTWLSEILLICPIQDFTMLQDDQKLFEKYSLTEEEIDHITNSNIRTGVNKVSLNLRREIIPEKSENASENIRLFY